MNTTIEPISVLIKKSWEVVKINWRKFARFIAVTIGIGIIVGIAVFIIGFIVGFIWGIVSGNHVLPAFLTIPLSFIDAIVNLTLMGIFTFASAKFVSNIVNGENATPWEVIKPFILDYRNIFVTVVLASALLYGGMIIIVPAIFFYYGTLLYIYTAGVEGKRGLAALIQSYWYTNNKKAHLFGKLLGISLYLLVGIIAYGIILTIILVIISKLKLVILTSILGILFAVLTGILFIILVMVMQVVMYNIYIQLKNQAPETIDPVFFENKKKKFKIFIGIGLVLMVLFIASKPFIPEENSFKADNRSMMPKISDQVQSYSNEKFAYSLNYPGSFFKKESAGGESTMFYSLKNTGENIIVAVMKKETGDEVVNNFVSDLKSDPEVSNFVSLGNEKVTLDSLPANKINVAYTDGTDKEKTKTSLVSASSDDGWVFILMHSCYVDTCDYTALDTIVSSFKIE